MRYSVIIGSSNMGDKKDKGSQGEATGIVSNPKSEVPVELGSLETIVSENEWRNCPSPESPRKHVKSTAVVKYSTVQTLANFAALQCNTDLNSPPSNWLRSSADSYGLQHVPSHSTGFSSFKMAHMFPECVGEVDVVSDAENIKKLLKIPYSKGPVSMMVHRIENTLLIDEFDIHKYLLRTAESEWEWLKKFFFEHVLQSLNEKERGLSQKNKSRGALQRKSLVSKFLYHSLAVAQGENECPSEPQTPPLSAAVPLPIPVADPPLPEPNLEEELPDATSNHTFTRNVVWTFEDIQMLIGTNLPIFGGKTHPCISLKLRDMSKPINVLTGIDYWLDNLMCNVPELVMCYHLDGIVQKYELIKTEDLPHLENSKFSPIVIRDVAQNILSFLKSNAAKAGHTYWLFKGKDAEIVKLYDLTSLCTEMMDDKGQNPFTIPVGMLLYRVARNMKHSAEGETHQGTIRLLLKNCIDLLPKEKYPQIVASAHYMLADLYIPADTDPAAPNLSENLEEEKSPSEYEEEEADMADQEATESCLSPSSSVDVKSLCVSMSPPAGVTAPPPPVCGDVEERCNSALGHVVTGLQCLNFFDCSSQERSESQGRSSDGGPGDVPQEPDAPKMAKPFEAIPMPYSPLREEGPPKSAKASAGSRKGKKEPLSEQHLSEPLLSPRSLLCKYRAEAMPTWQQPKPSDKVFWRSHLKILLNEKACLVYATLAENKYTKGSYGSALRNIGMVLKCQQQLEVVAANGMPNLGLQSYLLGRAGDLCFMIVQDWLHVKLHRKQYNAPSDVDKELQRLIESSTQESTVPEFLPQSIDSMEQMLLASQACYQRALQIEPVEQQRSTLKRRLGNIENELGVLYMNQAAALYSESGLNVDSVDRSVLQDLLNKSMKYLDSGVHDFETVRDEANLALLHSNKGRLLRMWAHYHCPDSQRRSQLASQERYFYNKAFLTYQKALQVLGSRKCNPAIWDTVMWEVSTTLFSMATILQDYPSIGDKTAEEAEREVAEYLQKALKYCDLDTPGARLPVYQYRAACIHHRLGSLYHRSYRNLPVDDSKRKNVLQLSRLHYEKASKLLQYLEQPTDYLRVQLERVGLTEFQSQSAGNSSARVKALLGAVDFLVECVPMLKIIQEKLLGDETKKGVKKSHQKNLTGSTKGLMDFKLSQEQAAGSSSESGTSDDCAEHLELDGLLQLLQQRLQYILLQLVKLHHNRGGQAKKETDSVGNMYKNLYSLTLRKNSGKDSSGKKLTDDLIPVLNQIETSLTKGSKIR